TIHRKYLYTLIIFSCLLLFLNANNFIFHRFDQSQEKYRISGEFNHDFTNLLSYTKQLDSSGDILWLPLNYPSYITVEDQYHDHHYYMGLSVMPILTNFSDRTGYLSFSPVGDLSIANNIFTLIAQKRYEDVGKWFELLNIKYI